MCVCYISKSNDTSAKIIQLLRGEKNPNIFLLRVMADYSLAFKPAVAGSCSAVVSCTHGNC